MATTDTRSGFRLPWSSDRNHDTNAVDEAVPASGEAVAEASTVEAAAWPLGDSSASGLPAPEPGPADVSVARSDTTTAPAAEEPAMIDLQHSPAPAPVAPRKPSKLMVDLSAAIRATAESARDQALAQVDAEVTQVVEAIRSGSKEGEDSLRVRSDEDIARIKEWSRAEIARIKEETERRIESRRLGLDEELAAHAAAIEQRVGEVEATVAAFRADMDAYAEGLVHEDDPSRLATMAESMPEPPALGRWTDLASLAVTFGPVDEAVDAEPAEAVAEPAAAEPEPVAEEPAAAEPEPAEPEPVAEEPAAAEAPQPVDDPSATGWQSGWGETESSWAIPATSAVATAGSAPESAGDDLPRWTAGEAGDAAERGAIMTALETDAEAVVAAGSTDETEGIADDDGTTGDRAETDEELDPEAAAALSARLDAVGFDESVADRLAALVPAFAETVADGEPRTTRVIVAGLVSVASIASFKRHLARLDGVQAVAVASGPDGEFVFNVTHRPDVSFRDALPTMPGFAARVTGTGDDVIQVTARDPEAEG